MSEPEELYTAVYRDLGIILRPQHRCPLAEIAEAESRLGMSVPKTLRAYFEVAGREDQLNCAHNHLLSPSDWFVDQGRLAFLEENQAVVFWGVEVGANALNDPPILQGINAEPIDWHPEHGSTAEFLCIMLCWQAVMGGLAGSTSAVAPADLPNKLGDWSCLGEINGMRAYSRSGVGLCWLPWEAEHRVFVGASDLATLKVIQASLQLPWEEP